VAEELERQGFRTAVTIQENPFLKLYASKFSIFVFHRTLYTSEVAKLIAEIKKLKKEIIFETDDLLFDPECIRNSDYFKNISALEKGGYKNGIGGEILNDPYVKTCTTTTSFLAEKLKGTGKRVFVVSNKLSQEDVRLAEKVLENPKEEKGFIQVGYFSGSASHNRDFGVISEALVEIMEKYPEVRLLIVGPLELAGKILELEGRIDRLPFAVSRQKHFENISRADVNLAPLEIGDPFCEAKSELKFFEAGILKVPTVASATQAFCEAIQDSQDGFVANSKEEWTNKLEKLINNKELREEMGGMAREKALRKYSTQNADNKDYYNYLKSKIV
jgi:glycosyltransferase involved in cell wall biosynthesis